VSLFDRLRGRGGRRRVGVVGLDGVGLPLVRTLVGRGVMPRLGEFLEAGSAAPMKSTIPTISSVSWAGFMTGNNPGRHGIYGFTDIEPVEFKQYFPNFRHIRAPTILDILGEHERRAVVVNVPGTYPAREVSGVLISGFVAIKLAKAVYPPALLPKLERDGYKVDVDYARANERPDEFFIDLFETLDVRRRVLLDLVRDEQWDLFVGVITETDRLHHYFWDVWEDESSRYHQRFVEFYAAVDRCVGDLLDAFGDIPAMVLADHGHMLIESEFYPNVWLREQGFLSYCTDPPRTVADIDRSSRAFVLDPGRVYLNLKGRYPTGRVEPADADSVLSEIVDGLGAVECGGKRPVARVFRRDELYDGDCLDAAPDVVLHFSPGFDIKGSMRAKELFGRSALTGMHTYDDSLFCASKPGLDLADLEIIDVAPTILGALGLGAAATMDGTDRGLC
jgi:predicted AlkP superfamily phosphohydrolase/phosphomutase